jgi:hypothetical protein
MVLVRSIGFVVAMVMIWPCPGLAQTTFYATQNEPWSVIRPSH